MNFYRHLRVIFLAFIGFQFKECARLNGFVNYYEPLYNQWVLMGQSSLDSTSKNVIVAFKAFNRYFKLDLMTDSSVLSSTAKIILQKNTNLSERLPVSIIQQVIVTGKDLLDPSSQVHGSFLHEVFEGSIHCASDSFYVESSYSFFGGSAPFRTIIYRQRDINVSTSSEFSPKSKRFIEPEMKLLEPERKLKAVVTQSFCQLSIVADYSFYSKAGDLNVLSTLKEMLFLVQEADRVFKTTMLGTHGQSKAVRFQVREIKIYLAEVKQWKEKYSSIKELLNIFSKTNYAYFCLAILFTHKSFTDATETSFKAEPSRDKVHGICGVYFNTAVISLERHGKREARAISIGRILKALGRNFGCDDDPVYNKKCSPRENQGGPYIMGKSVLKYNRNSFTFSPCSIKAMMVSLNEQSSCFKEKKPICGNAIREDGEECDCGPSEFCDKIDPCCYSMLEKHPCQLRKGAMCSAKDNLCCTKECSISPKTASVDCTASNDCIEPSGCTGKTKDCPPPLYKKEGTICMNGAGECRDQLCRDTVCSRLKMKACECQQPLFMCHLCCFSLQTSVCIPAEKFGLLNRSKLPYIKPDNSKCHFEWGVCLKGECKFKKQFQYIGSPETSNIMFLHVFMWLFITLSILTSCIVFIGFCFLITRLCRETRKPFSQ